MTQSGEFSGINQMLADAARLLDKFNAGTGTAGGQQSEPPRGSGTGADGLITATAVPPGRLSEFFIDSRAMRLDSVTLAEEVTRAVNEALADLQRATDSGGPVDLSTLGQQLREVQENAGRQLSTFNSALVAAQQRLSESGGK